MKINNKKFYIYYLSIGLVFIISLNIFYTVGNVSVKEWNIGDIATEDIIAPYTFDILKPEEEFQKEQDEAASNVSPVLQYRKDITTIYTDSIKALLDTISVLNTKKNLDFVKRRNLLKDAGCVFSDEILSVALRIIDKKKAQYIYKVLSDLYTKGIIQTKDNVPLGTNMQITIKKGEEENFVSLNSIKDIKESYSYVHEKIYSKYPNNKELIKFVDALMSNYVKPNLKIDFDETTRRREAARAAVSRKMGIVFKGEMIVRAHDQITKDVLIKLNSMKVIQRKHTGIWATMTGRNILFILLFFMGGIYIYFYRPLYIYNYRIMSVIYIVFAFMLSIVIFLKLLSWDFIYIPVVVLTLAISLLLDEVTAFVVTLIFAIIIYIYDGMRFHTGLMFVMMSFIIIWSERKLQRRRDLYSVIVWVFIFQVIYILGDGLLRGMKFPIIGKRIFIATLANIIGTFFVSGILPVLEQISGKSTIITLLELSSLNHPILKEMTIQAAGTYHHSIIVGSIAEGAARAIGANSLLVKVGALFHDIGKTPRAKYFIENLVIGMKNPHDNIPPWRSAQILISHVKDGEKMAKKYKLPDDIIAFIKEHHGTTLMEYFYSKAQEENDGKAPVDEYIYRYPGPKPKTKETAIVMLADAVEAAVRSLDNPTGQNIIRITERVIKKRMDDGQLDESPLTLYDVYKIKEAFVRMLNSIYHTRIKYPYQGKGN